VFLGKDWLPITVCVLAAVSEKVKEGKAHGVEMCGEKLVLFRGKDGKVSCYPAPLLACCCSILHVCKHCMLSCTALM